MKKLLLIASLLASISSLASNRTTHFCTGDVEKFAPTKEYIAVSAAVNSKTGVTKSIQVHVTYTNLQDCKSAIENKDFVTQIEPVKVRLSKKCYASSSNSRLYYLFDEERDVETGLVSKLAVITEFDSLKSCASNL